MGMTKKHIECPSYDPRDGCPLHGEFCRDGLWVDEPTEDEPVTDEASADEDEVTQVAVTSRPFDALRMLDDDYDNAPRTGVITVEHSQSSDGIPVLVLDGQVYGPDEWTHTITLVSPWGTNRGEERLWRAARAAGYRCDDVHWTETDRGPRIVPL